MVLPLSKGENVLGFDCLSVGEGCSLSPEWPELGDNGGAHGTTPVKPIVLPLYLPLCAPSHPIEIVEGSYLGEGVMITASQAHAIHTIKQK